MATLAIVPRIETAERPADLARVAVPRLNKCDWIEEYTKQLETRDYDLEWARVEETRVLSCKEWNELMRGLLTDRDWLAGKGGTSSWTGPNDGREWFKLSESEQAQWKRGAFIHVIAVQCAGQTIYIDPQGYNYARYVAFAALGLPEGKTRAELERERAKAEADKRMAAKLEQIANPPTVPEDHGLRFLWNGIKAEGKLTRCYYSFGNLSEPWPAETITVYARDYSRFPGAVSQCFHVEDNSDPQSDYFDDAKLRVCPNHPLYALVKAAWEAQKLHDDKRAAKRAQKWGSIDA